MIRFEPTTDYELVRRMLSQGSVYFRMANDDAPQRERFQVQPCEGIEYVIARNDAEPIGLFLLVGSSGNSAEVHFCFLPSVWGRTERAGKLFLEWAWQHTGYLSLRAAVPAYNRLALRLAERCGFRKLAEERHAVRKHGKWYSRTLLEIQRPLHE